MLLPVVSFVIDKFQVVVLEVVLDHIIWPSKSYQHPNQPSCLDERIPFMLAPPAAALLVLLLKAVVLCSLVGKVVLNLKLYGFLLFNQMVVLYN